MALRLSVSMESATRLSLRTVAHIAVRGKVACHDLIAVETDPDDAHLGADERCGS
jgi:hypothetical protein